MGLRKIYLANGMTQEEKQLLLKDLCARLPFGVILDNPNPCGEHWDELISMDILQGTVTLLYDGRTYKVEKVKPYLRPMSSMTEEEKKIMISYGFELIPYDTGYTGFANIENYIDEVSFRFMEEFLNSHHFDYRGLIPMGLAIESPKDMYQKP